MAEVRDILVMVLLFSAMGIGTTIFYTSLYSNYGVTAPENMASFNATESVLNITSDMQSQLTIEISDPSTWLNFVWIGFNALQLILNIPAIMGSIIADIFGIQYFVYFGWFVAIAVGIVAIVVIFALINALTKVDA